jgi:DNA-binding MarR family transcriptional regulator
MPNEEPDDAISGGSGVRWLGEAEQRAWRAQVRLALLLTRQLDRELAPLGLTVNDYEILVELSEAPGQRMRMTELADATAQSRSRLSHQITRMETRGLVRRDACEGDKRGMFAALMPDGLVAIERAAPAHVESVRRHYLDWLTPEQLSVIREAYDPIIEQLQKIRNRD